MAQENENPKRTADQVVSESVPDNWSETADQVLETLGFRFDTATQKEEFIKSEFGGGKVTLDAGSGYEAFAVGILGELSKLGEQGNVINLNPALSTSYIHDTHSVKHKDGAMRMADPKEFPISPSVDAAVRVFNMLQVSRGSHYGIELPPDKADSILLQRESVAGLLQKLPFADNSFDRIISTYYYPGYLLSHEKNSSMLTPEAQAAIPGIIIASLEEMARCLKPEGKVLLSAGREGQRERFEEYVATYRELNAGAEKLLSVRRLSNRNGGYSSGGENYRLELTLDQTQPEMAAETRVRAGGFISRALSRRRKQ